MAGKPSPKKSDDVCRSCMVRRDKHNTKVPCPHFVEPADFIKQTIQPVTISGLELLGLDAQEPMLNAQASAYGKHTLGMTLDELAAKVATPTTSRDFDRRVEEIAQSVFRDVLGRVEKDFRSLQRDALNVVNVCSVLKQEVEALKKQLASAPRLDPMNRAFHERYPYATAMSEEDLLEEDYRGWPKPRITF